MLYDTRQDRIAHIALRSVRMLKGVNSKIRKFSSSDQ